MAWTTVTWRFTLSAVEKLAFLESRVEEQAMRIDDVREAIVNLERRFELLEQRLDRRFDSIDARFGRVYGLLIVMLVAIVGGMSGIIAAIISK